MAKALAVVILLAFSAGIVAADVLVLRDGRTLIGTVTVTGDTVDIRLAHGTSRFSWSEVVRIERKQTPADLFESKLASVPKNDPDALCAIATWAAEQDLTDQAQEVYGRIIEFAPDHAATRLALGHMRVDGQWRDLDGAIELARGRLAAGKFDGLLKGLLLKLESLAEPRGKGQAVRDIQAHTLLRAKKFAEATTAFRDLATETTGPDALRYAAIAETLEQSKLGMYVLCEPYPPAAALLRAPGPSVPAGPASLAQPLVLEAALRERAKKEIKAGREVLDLVRSLEASDADAARNAYFRAAADFSRADALVPGIARTYLVEIARRRIAGIRKQVDVGAQKFDAALAMLGKTDVSPQSYRSVVQRLVHNLDGVRDKLKSILLVAKVYPDDLALEIEWAKDDLKKIIAMRKILTAELDG